MSFIFLWQNTISLHKNHLIKDLISFVILLVYLEFLDTILSLDPSFLSIHLVLRYKFISRSMALSNFTFNFPSYLFFLKDA